MCAHAVVPATTDTARATLHSAQRQRCFVTELLMPLVLSSAARPFVGPPPRACSRVSCRSATDGTPPTGPRPTCQSRLLLDRGFTRHLPVPANGRAIGRPRRMCAVPSTRKLSIGPTRNEYPECAEDTDGPPVRQRIRTADFESET